MTNREKIETAARMIQDFTGERILMGHEVVRVVSDLNQKYMTGEISSLSWSPL